jgi:TDG/mug DNA glycosylase family protein
MQDILGPGIQLLFVGFNPSLKSAETGHHYAGRGNEFWRLLHAAGLTPLLLKPDEDRELLRFGIGSTNLVKRPTRDAAELSRAELRAGAPRIAALVRSLRPRIVAYTGKGVYIAAAARSSAAWGLQPERLFPPAFDFVVPSPSGLVRMTFEQKLQHYRALRRSIEQSAAHCHGDQRPDRLIGRPAG